MEPSREIPGPSQAFALPAVGLQLSLSSQPVAASGTQTVANQPAVKSIKTQLHQRANRIGKLEQRIGKLQAGMQEVSATWPSHVQELAQTLQTDFQKCQDFQSQASQELTTLQAELQSLLTQGLDQEIPDRRVSQPVLPIAESPASPSVTSLLPQVYAAISQLQAHGLIQVNMPAVVQSPMDCTDPPQPVVQTPVVSSFSQAAPSVYSQQPVGQASVHPSVGFVQQPQQVQPPGIVQPPQLDLMTHGFFQAIQAMQLPVQSPNPGTMQLQEPAQNMAPMQPPVHKIPDLHEPMTPPPGNWTLPQSPPAEPNHVPLIGAAQTEAPQESVQMFPNPLYKARAQDQTPCQQLAAGKPIQAMKQAVEEATAAMVQMHSVSTFAELPPQVQQQLNNFAVQQEYCRQQLAQIVPAKYGAMTPPPKHRTQQSPTIGPQGVEGMPTPLQMPPSHPPQGQDAFSVKSSPAQVLGMSASPPGQRTPKIAKVDAGHVHQQPAVNKDGVETVPIPLSPTASQASMVPTEIADDEWHGPQSAAPLG